MGNKIVFTFELTHAQQEQVQAIASQSDWVHGKESAIWSKQLQEADVIVGWHKAVVEHCIDQPSKLRWLQYSGAGIEKLPLATLAERDIWLTNASGIHAYPISESVFAMLLAMTRNLHLYLRNQLEQRWAAQHPMGELHGKTMAIIGVGAIGEEIARLAKAFQMKVLGVRRSGLPAEGVDRMYGMNELEQALQQADYVVNTLPLTDETAGCIGAPQFKQMPNHAVYVNIGRGGTTDEPALIDALQDGEIAGACLDVFAQEPQPQQSPLWKMSNVIMTPHISGATSYYNDRLIDIFVQNYKVYQAGARPEVNYIDLKARQQY